MLATLRSTLEPTTNLILDTARRLGLERQVASGLCEGAFDAITAGDVRRHDDIVAEKLRTLMPEVDVIVLAQASMARVIESMPPGSVKLPVLSSPRSGVERVQDLLNRRGRSEPADVAAVSTAH